MELAFQLSRKDFIDFYKSLFRDSLKKKIGFILLFAFLVAMGFTAEKNMPLTFAIIFLGTVLAGISIFYFIPLFNTVRRINQLPGLPGSEWFLEYFLYTAESGMIIHKSRTEQIDKIEIKWSYIDSFHSNEIWIWIKLVDKSIFLIPKRFFSSPEEIMDFLGLMNTEMRRLRGLRTMPTGNTGILLKKEREKPSYWFGLFGLVPVFGVIAGVTFIYLGIKKFRDKGLIYIGILGILISICTTAYFVHLGRSLASEAGKGFVSTISQMELHVLIKNIEAYKTRHGIYPDSLQQLENGTKIYDAKPNGRNNPYFNYQKIGNRYTLFLAGEDGLIHTADDVYPVFSEYDSSKYGFIMPH